MHSSPSAATPLARDDVVSPELALVDPDLAERARHVLEEPTDTHRRSNGNGKPPSAATTRSAPALSPIPAAAAAAPAPTPTPTPMPSALFAPAPSVVRAPTAPALIPARDDDVAPSPPDDQAVEAARRLDELATRAEEPPASLARRFRRVIAAVAVACVGLVLALLLADRQLAPQEVGVEASSSTERPGLAETVEGLATDSVESPPSTEPVDEPSPSSPGQETTARPEVPTASRTQAFAWAPVAGATAYHVELFLRSTRVFAANTPRAKITIPRSWTFEGKRHELERAEYRWYVWPVVRGKRTAEAVVQARLVVGDR